MGYWMEWVEVCHCGCCKIAETFTTALWLAGSRGNFFIYRGGFRAPSFFAITFFFFFFAITLKKYKMLFEVELIINNKPLT